MRTAPTPAPWKIRTRWAAAGAAAAVVVGAGGIAISGATNAQLTPSTTDIAPCRIMDTRASSQVGPRSTPLGAGATHTIQVTGRNGNCSIPTDATGVVLNLTVANIGADGFITVFPDGTARPTASNINYGIFQKPLANLVDTTLGSNGRLSFFALNGPVDLVADVTAYTTGARLSTNDLAQERWDRDRARPTSLALDGAAGGAAFDGSAIWVANFFAGTVTKVDARTGTKSGSDIPVGGGPFGVAFDGTRIWVANSANDTVSRIDAATGTRILPDVAVGDGPTALVFDGTRLWVANTGSSSLSRIDVATGVKVPADIGGIGATPNFLAFDGTAIWALNSAASTIARFSAATGGRISPDLTTGSGAPSNEAFGIGFDGTRMWVANRGSDSVSRFDASSGTRLLPDIAVGDGPQNPVFDGAYVWVTNSIADSVSRIEAVSNTVSATVPVADTPNWTVFDGTSVWTTTLGLGSRLLRLAPALERP